MKIETKRLIFRDWRFEDADVLVDAFSNADVAKNLTVPFPYTKQNAFYYINENICSTQNNYSFAVVRKEDGKIIGGTSLNKKENPDEDNGGLWLCEKYHGKGYGTEIWTAMAKLWFEDKNNNCIVSGYFSFNKASEKLHTKLGFKPFAKKSTFCPALNKEVETICAKLSRQDFEKFYKTLDFDFAIE